MTSEQQRTPTPSKDHEYCEGDAVRHDGECIDGEVVDTNYLAPKFKVKWEDGYETLESFHTVELITDE
jgi:hypothetical protein